MSKEEVQVIIAIIAGTLVLLILGSFIFYFLFLYQRRHNRYVEEVDQMKTQYEQELLKTQLDIQELTLSHISQEIHDNIGQMLTVVKVQLGSIETSDNVLLEKLDTSFQILTRTIQDLRNLSRNLNTDYISEKGLVHCLTEELSVIEKSGILQVRFQIQGEGSIQNPHWELIVFRILQELVNNAIKHAHCTSLSITANYLPERLDLIVSDNGIGFDAAAAVASNSIGLRSIRKRVEVLGGQLTIQSAPGEGSSIYLSLPFGTAHQP